jgi:glycine cleavage system H lipoate-binding protein
MDLIKKDNIYLVIPALVFMGYKALPTIKDVLQLNEYAPIYSTDGFWMKKIGYKKYAVGVTKINTYNNHIKNIVFSPEKEWIRKPHRLFHFVRKNEEKNKICIPVSAKIISINHEILNELDDFNNSAEKYWIVIVKVLQEQFVDKLMTEEEYIDYLK